MKRLSLTSTFGGLMLLLLGCVHDDTPDPSGNTLSIPIPIGEPWILIPSPWTDPAGDVTLSNADMIGGTIVVGNGTVELRLQFVNPPFPTTATHDIGWCIDLDQNPDTGDLCRAIDPTGADAVVGVQSVPGRPVQLFVLGAHVPGGVELDPALHLAVDSATNTLRICIPDSLLLRDTQFNYVVNSNFGGSGGHYDAAPDNPDFHVGAAFVNEVGTPSHCCPSVSSLCDLLGARADGECPCSGSWRNHGAYVACVAGSVKQGLTELGERLSPEQRDGITGCVVAPRARSDCGRK